MWSKKNKFTTNNHTAGSIDIHKLIGKLPRPNSGFIPAKYKYLGPYNNLNQQVEYDDSGNITKYHVKPVR